jgi:chromosome segregation ATPase
MKKTVKKVKPKKVVKGRGAAKSRKDEMATLKRKRVQLRKESNAKIKELETKVKEVTENLEKKEAELRYAHDKIFQLEAKIRELEEKLSAGLAPSHTPPLAGSQI